MHIRCPIKNNTEKAAVKGPRVVRKDYEFGAENIEKFSAIKKAGIASFPAFKFVRFCFCLV
jgi:hypothetical protein